MKKLILSLVAIVAFTFAANAQELGVTGGLNTSTLTSKMNGKDANAFVSKSGFNFGILADFNVSEKFSVQPELKFSAQGAIYKDDKRYINHFNYLNIPIKVKYYIIENLDIFAGSQIGFLMSARTKFTEDGKKVNTDVKKELAKTDFGAVFGAEYVTDSGFGLGLGYNVGLSNINNDKDIKKANKLNNSVFNVNLIYKLSK